MKRHDGDHNPDEPVILDDGRPCLGCRIRGGFVPNLGADVTVTRTRSGERDSRKLRPMQGSSYNKGIAGEHRPGGGFMPYLGKNGAEIGIKEGGERRHEIAKIRDSQRHNPNHFATG